MLLEDKIVISEENPVLLRRAMVLDDGYFVSLVLCPPQTSAIPDAEKGRRYITVVLYRRKRELWTVGCLLPLGSLEAQLVKAAGSLATWWRPIQILAYLWYRTMLVRSERFVRRVVFVRPPILKLIWEDSEKSVALLINGEPWAMIIEKRGAYSKGVIRGEGSSNLWDQNLFDQIFAKGL